MIIKMLPTVGRTVISRSLKAISKKILNLSSLLDYLDVLTNEEKRILSKNAIFKNTHKGKRAFVIANGPSLKKQDLSLLKQEITFAVSAFWKHPIVADWQPTYYSILDKAFFNNEDSIRLFYKEMNKRINKSIFFLPLLRGYEFNIRHQYFDPSKTFYVAAYGDPSPSVDLTSAIQSFQSVSAFALAQAIYMGCNPIYLLGFDHDYLAHRGLDHHFYEGCSIKDHKHESIPLSDLYSYDHYMSCFLRLWKNYRSLKAIAAGKNISIINATDGGYLDVFDRINYCDIFTSPKTL